MIVRLRSFALAAALVGVAVTFGSVPSALADDAPAAGAPGTMWKVTGQLEESCSCDGACPCWFNHKPTRMTCSGGAFFFIDKGNYGDTSLDGLAVGAMVQTPAGKTMMESVGDWNFSYLYVDEKGSPEQRKALLEIMKSSLPPVPASRMKVRYVPITRTIEGEEHKIAFGNYGSFSGHVVSGGMGGPSKIVNPPGADPFHKEYEQGETTKQVYADAAKWQFEKTNYMFNHFEVTSDEMGRYNAAMAEMMKKMAAEKAAAKKASPKK